VRVRASSGASGLSRTSIRVVVRIIRTWAVQSRAARSRWIGYEARRNPLVAAFQAGPIGPIGRRPRHLDRLIVHLLRPTRSIGPSDSSRIDASLRSCSRGLTVRKKLSKAA